MCPECGDEVFSQSDVDAYETNQKAAKARSKVVIIVLLVVVGGIALPLILFVVFFAFLLLLGLLGSLR